VKHPFEIGGKYRNNNGSYEVKSINGDKMVIVYDDGQEQLNSVALMRRVWERLERERISPPVEERPTRGGRTTPRFDGLAESDFKDNVTGTHWRARTQLGGALMHRLTEKSKRRFQSYAIYRWPEVHIVMPERYDPARKVRQAKFLFRLDPQMARYALYIEKSSDPMDETWDWLRFRQAIGERPWQERLERVLQSQGMSLEAFSWQKETAVCVLRLVVDATGLRQTVPQDSPTTWDAVLDFLDSQPTDQWCDVYVGSQSGKQDALSKRAGIAEVACDAYEPLIPLYDAITRTVVRVQK